MTKRLMTAATIAVAFAGAASLVLAGITMATQATRVNFEFTPSTVSRHGFTAGALHLHLRTVVPPTTRASRIRFDLDKHFRFAPGAFPTCDPGDISNSQVDMATAMAHCGSANIGSGTAQATDGSTTLKPCVLAFNGSRQDGVPTVLLFVRVRFSPPAADCSDPASNHTGNASLLVEGFLGQSSLSGYGRELRFNRLTRAQPFPLTHLNLALQSGNYVSARCSVGDSFHGWQLRTKVGYVKPRSVQVVESTQRCAPPGADRAESFEAAGPRE